MDKKEIEKKINEYVELMSDLKVNLNLDFKIEKINELESLTTSTDFWNDAGNSKDVLSELKSLKEPVNKYNNVSEQINMIKEMITLELSKEEINELSIEIETLDKDINELKIETLLNNEYDSSNAYIEIHSGAGGTESNDWANMLYKMYSRFFEKNDYSYTVVSEQKGEEVGLKGITLLVKGYYPYGYLKSETGVHRLVRISPFDSNKRRHTSFASVLVTPEINKNIDIEIKDSDIKIDVYHSSGAGGQSVNTTDSAVRITHLKTGLVTSCQTERSQVKNKEIAMNMLKNKLYMLSLKEFEDKINSLKGDNMDVNFGSATRSYVMCPYTLVKDNKSNYETANVDKVLDGDIEEFIEEGLKNQ